MVFYQKIIINLSIQNYSHVNLYMFLFSHNQDSSKWDPLIVQEEKYIPDTGYIFSYFQVTIDKNKLFFITFFFFFWLYNNFCHNFNVGDLIFYHFHIHFFFPLTTYSQSYQNFDIKIMEKYINILLTLSQTHLHSLNFYFNQFNT